MMIWNLMMMPMPHVSIFWKSIRSQSGRCPNPTIICKLTHCYWSVLKSRAFWCVVAPPLDMSMPSRLPSDCVVPLSYHALSPQFPQDLDVSLSGSEDEGLAFRDCRGSVKNELHRSVEKIPYKRHWRSGGGLKFPAKAKFGNCSFKFVLATERTYCQNIGNRAVKQSCLLSFQRYRRAMENARRVATKRKSVSEPADLTSDHSDSDQDGDGTSKSSS